MAGSKEVQLRQLLTGIELNDQKSSELLREMTRLADTHIAACVLHTLWLQRLPKRIQELLTVVGEMELSKLAEIADKIWSSGSSCSSTKRDCSSCRIIGNGNRRVDQAYRKAGNDAQKKI